MGPLVETVLDPSALYLVRDLFPVIAFGAREILFLLWHVDGGVKEDVGGYRTVRTTKESHLVMVHREI